MEKRKIGILGGMGPISALQATKIIYDNCKVEKDSDYPDLILFNIVSIPSRTRAFLYGELPPTERIEQLLFELDSLKLTDIMITCNSAHYFLPESVNKLNAKFWNLIENTSINALQQNKKSYLLLGGEVTVKSGIYKQFLNNKMTQINYSDLEFRNFRLIIDAVKNNTLDFEKKNIFYKQLSKLIKKKEETLIILACTELVFFYDGLISKNYCVIDSIHETIKNISKSI